MPDQPTSAATTPRLEQIVSFAEVERDWSNLAEAGGDIFSTWEWASIWWRHFGAGGELDLTACRNAHGDLLAILPLFRKRIGPLRVTRLVGYPIGSRAHPVCGPSNRTSAALGLVAALERQKTDLFIGEGFPEDEGWAERLPGTTVASVPSPTLMLTPFETWDDYLETRSSNFRQDIRRKERKLLRDNDVVYRLATDRGRLESDVDAFLSLHADRWATGSSLLETSRIAFHREFARVAFDRGWLRLWFLELAGEPAAAWYGFRFGGVETYYQAGRAPAHADGSLGVVLLAHTIREALGDGVAEYRFGPGGSSYKYRFTDTDPGLRTVLIPTSRRGRLAVSASSLTSRSAVLRRSVAKLVRRS